jgi:hypothetical protein
VKTSAFGVEARRILAIIQRFGSHCSCHLQSIIVGYFWQMVLIGGALK